MSVQTSSLTCRGSVVSVVFLTVFFSLGLLIVMVSVVFIVSGLLLFLAWRLGAKS
jgi:type IV secretory pathway TrbL component